MAIHLQDFNISSYRGIKNLSLAHLNHINILTGDNNSGKTSILELISTVNAPSDMESWLHTCRGSSFYHGFFNMFSISEEEKKISYNFTDSQFKKWEISLQGMIEKTQIEEKEMYRINGYVRKNESKEEENILDTNCMHLNVMVNDVLNTLGYIYDFQKRIRLLQNKKKQIKKTVYIAPFDHSKGKFYLDNVLADTQLFSEMIKILQEFDENIINITAVSINDKTEYMIMSKNHTKALPLTVYGDGMKKAILLLGAIMNAKDGILLLDEFETAIHTSAMDTLFSWLLESALKLNVQVFLTSHSKEAIDKVLRCNDELASDINIYTLYKTQDENLVRMLTRQEAIDVQENLGLELR